MNPTQLDNLLQLRNNQLSRLPNTISQLTNLEYLDLSANQLTQLPDVIETFLGTIETVHR